jgi:imidazolonepropionase-like amidohydrolase
MKLPLLLSLGLVLWHTWAFRQSISTAPKVQVIRAGSLIDPSGNKIRHDQVIVVRNHRIETVGDASSVRIPDGALLIDLSQATVLPGLVDSHTHIFDQGETEVNGGYDAQLLKSPPAYRVARATASLRRALEQGFTTIRDVGTEGMGYGDIGLRLAVDQGYIPGPHIFASTRGISSTASYPLQGYNPDIQVPKGAQIIDGPIEARKAAREQLGYGADWIKVFMTHRSWIDKNGVLISQPTLTLEELKAIVDEAHGWKRKVACHAYSGEGLHRSLDALCDSIEHGILLDSAAIAQMKAQHTWYCPTLALFYSDWSPENTSRGQIQRLHATLHEQSFKDALRAGVNIVFGTDVGSFAWTEPIGKEFCYMVKFGMSPMDALRAATVNAAAMLDMTGEIGVIAPGAYADVIAVKGDPLRDVTELQRITFVMKNGNIFKSELQ